MTKPENVKYLSENFEIKVVSLLNSYVKDENGKLVEDDEGKPILDDWHTKYSPSIYPGIIFIDADGKKLVDGPQDYAMDIAKLVKLGLCKPLVGFLESAKNYGLKVYDGSSKLEALTLYKKEKKHLLILWYRSKGNNIHPHFGDEEIKKILAEKFIILALKRDEALGLDKRYPYRGAGSYYAIDTEDEITGVHDGNPAMTKNELMDVLTKK